MTPASPEAVEAAASCSNDQLASALTEIAGHIEAHEYTWHNAPDYLRESAKRLSTAYVVDMARASTSLSECCEQNRRLREHRNLVDAENAQLRDGIRNVLTEARASLRECGTFHTAEMLEQLSNLLDIDRSRGKTQGESEG